ncbi:MFS family permease [Corynebacterium guangdongense]|uniref:MFS family permease n=2 Tax=Corynebacterium guangdongense TaxID=1783348 RepID=A0ABU1ZXG9_9CORY|nr:MFS family permease [Corynebacterium guangdongense]
MHNPVDPAQEPVAATGRDPDGASATARRRRTRRASTRVPMPREIWILVAAAFLIAVGYGLIAPILPQFVVTFDVSVTAAAAVVSVFSFSRLITAPAAGTIGDRIGSRKVYLAGLIIVAVTTGLVAVAQAYWHILALRALAGFGSSMFSISAMGLIVKLAPPGARGRASALYGTAFLLGNVIGPLAGAAMSFLGMRWPFVIYGTGVLLAALVVWWLMPNKKIDRLEGKDEGPAEGQDEGAAGDKPDTSPLTLAEAWRSSAFRALLVSNFAHGWINMGVRVATIPLFAAAVFDQGVAMAGFAMAAYAAGNAVILQFSGRMADRIGRRPLILAGLVGSGVLAGFMGFADQPWSLLLFSILAGAAAGLLNPAQQAVLADVIGNERSGGRVLSTYQMFMDAGQILGPIMVGLLVDGFGYRLGFAICGLVAAVAAGAWIFGKETLHLTHAGAQTAR